MGAAHKPVKQSNAPVEVPMNTEQGLGQRKRAVANSEENGHMAASRALTASELFKILASERLLSQRMANLDNPLSEKNMVFLHRAQAVWPKVIEVMGDASAARHWLSKTNRSLGGKSPLALLHDEDGDILVLDTLGRIEYGIVS